MVPDAGAAEVHGRRETEEWERHYFRTRRNLALRRRRLGYFGFRPDERVVEIGCGDGLNLALLRQAGARHAFGTDISWQFVSRVEGTPVFVGDVYGLPIGDRSVDALLIDSVLHHLMPLAPALGELHRILRPGGRMCVLEPRPTVLRWILDTSMDLVPFPPPLRARQLTYFEEKQDYKAWLRRFPELAGTITEAGFRITMEKRLPFGIALEARAEG